MSQPTIYDIEKLEIAKKLLEEVSDSENFKNLDYCPDLHLGDALQAIEEVLDAYHPLGYKPRKPTKYLYKVRPWHEKLKDHLFVALGDVSGALVVVAALSACFSVGCWGLSDAKSALGNKKQPDFAAQSQIYRALAIASISTALGLGVIGSSIKK